MHCKPALTAHSMLLQGRCRCGLHSLSHDYGITEYAAVCFGIAPIACLCYHTHFPVRMLHTNNSRQVTEASRSTSPHVSPPFISPHFSHNNNQITCTNNHMPSLHSLHFLTPVNVGQTHVHLRGITPVQHSCVNVHNRMPHTRFPTDH